MYNFKSYLIRAGDVLRESFMIYGVIGSLFVYTEEVLLGNALARQYRSMWRVIKLNIRDLQT